MRHGLSRHTMFVRHHRATSLRLACTALAIILTGPASAKPPASVFIEDLTTAEVREYLATGPTLALIYNGGTEETGPHIALGKHNFRVRVYSERIARAIGNTLVAPINPFSPNSPAALAFPGTFSLDPTTFGQVNEQLARSLITGGFRRIALMGDHGGGQKELAEVAKRLEAEFAPKSVHVFFISDSYQKARDQIETALIAAGKGQSVGHGGLWDTAETMATAPTAVRPRRLFPTGHYSDKGNGPVDANGVSGDAHDATVALGRQYGALRVKLAVEEIRRDLMAADAADGKH